MIEADAIRQLPGAGVEVDEDFDAVNDYCLKRGWTDGLPVVPPTDERVRRMLSHCDRDPTVPICAIPPRYGEATPLRIAANAVMAGCRPEYFPLVMLALEALCEKPFNLYAVQATTHSCAPLLVFNGPIAAELGMNAGHGALGSGTHSNATIGRAVRLSLVNIGGAIPGVGDMGTYGSPTKFSYCAMENEAANPWGPLHVERGLPTGSTGVSVFSAEGPHNINDHESTTALGILKTMAGSIANTGIQSTYHPSSEILVLVCPEHAATIAGEGYSKADIRQYLFENARLPLSRYSEENVRRRFKVKFGDRYKNASLDTEVPMVQSPDKFILMVMGGAGKHSAYIPSFGNTMCVTRMLRRADGSPAKSINEFRQD